MYCLNHREAPRCGASIGYGLDLNRGIEREITRRGIRHLIAAIIFLLASGPVWAETIGEVTQVRSIAYGTPPAEARVAKQIDDPVVFKEALETMSFSALEANLSDGSVVTLGASAKVVLDEFVYDPAAGANGLLINMGEGSLRFVTGSMKKESFKLETPTATLAVRGTNFKVRVRPNGDTLVAVDEGAVLVTVNSTGQQVEVREGQSVEVKRTGEAERAANETKRESSLPLPFLFGGSDDDDGQENSQNLPRGVVIDGQTYYDTIDFFPDRSIDVGNPIVDIGWQYAGTAGDKASPTASSAPPPNVKQTGDRPDKPAATSGQYGGDGCECSF